MFNESDSTKKFISTLDKNTDIIVSGNVVGRIYHRSNEPNSGKNHINIFLSIGAPKKNWQIELKGIKVLDGHYHSWIERDGRCRHCQTRFIDSIKRTTTTNTICNNFYSIVTGACSMEDGILTIAPFSSSGPTVDGRMKPIVLAPGVRVISSKSSGPSMTRGGKELVAMSGTSMASSFVAGSVALIFEAVNRNMKIHEVHELITGSCMPLLTDNKN